MVEFKIRCPNCGLVYNGGNLTKFGISDLFILLQSNRLIIFECNRCKHHIPVVFTEAFNIVSILDNSKYIISNKRI